MTIGTVLIPQGSPRVCGKSNMGSWEDSQRRGRGVDGSDFLKLSSGGGTGTFEPRSDRYYVKSFVKGSLRVPA